MFLSYPIIIHLLSRMQRPGSFAFWKKFSFFLDNMWLFAIILFTEDQRSYETAENRGKKEKTASFGSFGAFHEVLPKHAYPQRCRFREGCKPRPSFLFYRHLSAVTFISLVSLRIDFATSHTSLCTCIFRTCSFRSGNRAKTCGSPFQYHVY